MALLALLALTAPMALLLSPATVHGQDALGLISPELPGFETSSESEMRAKVAAAFPDAWLVRFRKVRPIASEAGREMAYCGQVSAAAPDRPEQNFHLFLYDRTAGTGSVRILGSEALNGYRVGRKLIGALKRVGCL